MKAILYDSFTNQWLSFKSCICIIQIFDHKNILDSLYEIESWINKGYFAVGFISYEASCAFDPALKVKDLTSFPLCWFGIYSQAEPISCLDYTKNRYELGQWITSISGQNYDENIKKIKEHITLGDTYQVNYTYRMNCDFNGDPFSLFMDLTESQPTSYSAYIETNDFVICSVSPELFFKIENNNIVTRPMKGTASRGRFLKEDKIYADWLYNSKKNRAENIMIVDMIRNDLGRIAKIGSVNVTSLFNIERYPTAFQMTSNVTAKTDASIPLIFQSLFPCASITGAPKPRTMEIIKEIEETPRKIYTGSIGFILPDKKAQFNVAIRTVCIDRSLSRAEYGVGGGIVWDSDTKEEFEECKTKSKIIFKRNSKFDLIETILWTKKHGFFLLDYHLNRLEDSSRYFGFKFNKIKIKKHLDSIEKDLSFNCYKVRLLLSKDGNISCQASPFDNKKDKSIKLKFAINPVQSSNPFLFHKTTNRKIYESSKKECIDCDDVILWNESNNITETCIYNIVAKIDGKFVTPALKCGLLSGTFRKWLLDHQKIKEKEITKDDLMGSEKIYVINSVRKWQKAVWARNNL